MNLKALSFHRKKASLLIRKRAQLERIALGRSPMVAASFMPRRLRPGAAIVYYLSASIQGESRHRYVRKGEVEYWRKRAMAWRGVMKGLGSWGGGNRGG